ncbi:hypothetical protein IGI80_000255 [Enterococcus sp. DIV1420a]
MKKMYKNLNKLTYCLYIFGVGLLIGAEADGKILLIYALVLMTYNLVIEFCSFNSWIDDNAGEIYKRKQNR